MFERVIQLVLQKELTLFKEELIGILQQQSQAQRYLTRKEVAVYLGIGLSTVDLWSRLGKLTKYRIDGSVRFDRKEIDEILHSKTRRHV